MLIPELLKQSGYRTMMVGKWQGRDSALDRGLHRFFGPMCQAKISYFHEVQQNPYYLNRERFSLPRNFYLTEALNEYAVGFLKEAVQTEEPFFLYVAHIAPHWPLHAREEEIAAYPQRFLGEGCLPGTPIRAATENGADSLHLETLASASRGARLEKRTAPRLASRTHGRLRGSSENH